MVGLRQSLNYDSTHAFSIVKKRQRCLVWVAIIDKDELNQNVGINNDVHAISSHGLKIATPVG